MSRIKNESYDMVIAWEGTTGFPLAFCRRLLRQKQPPLVILAFSVRGPLKSFTLLQRFGVKGMSYATVPTKYEKTFYATKLRFPEERIFHCPLGTHDLFKDTPGMEPGEIIFSGGRSGRDYDTLFRAVYGLPQHIHVNARDFNLRGLKVPANVEVHDLMPWYAYGRLLKRAKFVLIPLKKVDEAVGLSVILDSMAAGRALIVSDIPGTSEYIVHGETGLLVPPGNPDAMRTAIEYLWENPTLCAEMGRRARQIYEEKYTFPIFAQRVDKILHEILHED
jgi:glycosyltransferase involved in cell wall biosynthesis